MAFIGF